MSGRVTIVAVALLAACGSINIPGFTSKKPAPAAAVEEPDDGAVPWTEPAMFTIDATFANPNETPRFKHQATAPADRFGLENCTGWTTARPVAVLDVTEPSQHLEVAAPGAELLVVSFGSERSCHVPLPGETASITLKEWPVGKAKIFVGGPERDGQVRFSVRVEDWGRARDVFWAKDVALPRVMVTETPAKPAFYSFPVPPAKRAITRLEPCPRSYFRGQVDMVLEVARPVDGLTITARALEPTSILLIGPLTPDGRNLPLRCDDKAGDTRTFSRLEPGTYGLKVGGKDPEPAPSVNIVVTGQYTPTEPFTMVPSVPEKLSIAGRNGYVYFPQLTRRDLLGSDRVRFGVVWLAPRQLFVFPRYDLTKKLARFVPVPVEGPSLWPEAEPPPIDFPLKNEPLLLFDTLAVTADGLIFEVNPRDLLESPSGPVQLPALARNAHSTFEHSMAQRDPADEPAVKTLEVARKKFAECSDRITEPADARIEAIRKGPPTVENDQAVEDIKATTKAAVAEKCKQQEMEGKELATWKALIQSRTARRNAGLQVRAGRLKEMFNAR